MSKAGAELLMTDRAILGLFANRVSQPYAGDDWVARISSPPLLMSSEDGRMPFGGATPVFGKAVGPTRYDKTRIREIEVRNEEWDVGLEIPERWQRRDMLGILEQQANGFAMGVQREHWARLLSERLADAETLVGYDAVPFIGPGHAWGTSGPQSNLREFEAADFPADAAIGAGGANSPSIQAVAHSMTESAIAVSMFKNDRGLFSNMFFMRFLVMGTAKTYKRLCQAISTAVLAGGEINQAQALIQKGWTFEPVLNPLLNASFDVEGEFNYLLFPLEAQAWPLVRHFEQVDGGNDEGIDFRFKGRDTEHFTDNRSSQIKAFARRQVALGEPLSVFKVRIKD